MIYIYNIYIYIYITWNSAVPKNSNYSFIHIAIFLRSEYRPVISEILKDS